VQLEAEWFMQSSRDWPALSRRRFLASVGAGAFVLGASRNLAWAQGTPRAVLSGTEFDLEIGELPVVLREALDVRLAGRQERPGRGGKGEGRERVDE
jgi:hypothetical protein